MGKHNAKSTNGNTGVVVGDNKKSTVIMGGHGSKASGNKRKLLTTVIILALLAAGVAVYVYAKRDTSNTSNKPPVQVDPQSVAGKEIAKAEQRLANAGTTKERAVAYADLSNLYANIKSGNNKAIEYARDGVEQEGTIESYSQLAFVLEESGDYSGAADAYGKAADLAKKAGEPDDGRSGYSHYRSKQKEMESH